VNALQEVKKISAVHGFGVMLPGSAPGCAGCAALALDHSGAVAIEARVNHWRIWMPVGRDRFLLRRAAGVANEDALMKVGESGWAISYQPRPLQRQHAYSWVLCFSARVSGAGSALGEEVLTFVNGSVVMARATAHVPIRPRRPPADVQPWHHEWCC